MKHETIIITEQAYKFLSNEVYKRRSGKSFSEEQLNKIVSMKKFRNGGADDKTYPIKANEIRIDKDCFSIKIDEIKELLNKEGFGYRQDGFIVDCIYV